MALLAAMKFHCAAVHLEQPASQKWHALLSAIRSGITYFQQLVFNRVSSSSSSRYPWFAVKTPYIALRTSEGLPVRCHTQGRGIHVESHAPPLSF